MTSPMRHRAGAGLCAVGVLAFAAIAQPASARPHVVPADTIITGMVKPGTVIKLAARVGRLPVTVSCTTLSAKGRTPDDGLGAPLLKPPGFTGCSDNFGGTDTIATTGRWMLRANATGRFLILHVPAGGVVVTSSLLPRCHLMVGPAAIKGPYNNLNTWAITGWTVGVTSTGCTTSQTGTVTATIVLSPNVSVVG